MCANIMTEKAMKNEKYRENVLAVIIDREKKILVGERADRPGVWQMPQGGIDKGENSEQALMRELREEIGTNMVTIIRKLDTKISYDFPEELSGDIMKKYKLKPGKIIGDLLAIVKDEYLENPKVNARQIYPKLEKHLEDHPQ